MRACQRGLQQSAQFSDNHSNISIAPQFTTKPIYQKEPNISTPSSPIPAARTTPRSEKAQPRCGHLPGQSHDATGRGAEEKIATRSPPHLYSNVPAKRETGGTGSRPPEPIHHRSPGPRRRRHLVITQFLPEAALRRCVVVLGVGLGGEEHAHCIHQAPGLCPGSFYACWRPGHAPAMYTGLSQARSFIF